MIFLVNFFRSLFRGERAGDNPWEATTLEWVVPSPRPPDNFAGGEPIVYRGSYEFSVPGAPEDYILQTTPDSGEVNRDAHGHAQAEGQGARGAGGNGGNGHH